jgi:hypothetical protein
MHILLLIVYGALAGYGIWKMPFLRKSGIRPGWLLLLFAVHVLTGWLHNWIAWRYFPGHGDIWDYFSKSFLYRQRLLSDWNLFVYGNSTWTYLSHNSIIFVQMLLDLLSADDMNINTLLFAFPVFIGNVALFRVFQRHFASSTLASACVFWLPSVLFWTSCIYREGMLYMLLGFLFYHLDLLLTPAQNPGESNPTQHSNPRHRRHLICSLLLLALIAYFRITVAIILIPALLLFLPPPPRRRTVIIALSAIFILTLSIPALRDAVLHTLSAEQALFQVLYGHSRLSLPAMTGTLNSLIHTLPAAIRNGFFEPLPGSGGQRIYLVFSVELILIWLVAFLALISRLTTVLKTQSDLPGQIQNFPDTLPPPPAVNPAFLFFALAGMLTIGLTVPFAGAIVRYRSIYLPFLLAPALHTLRHLRPIQTLDALLTNRLKFLI